VGFLRFPVNPLSLTTSSWGHTR